MYRHLFVRTVGIFFISLVSFAATSAAVTIGTADTISRGSSTVVYWNVTGPSCDPGFLGTVSRSAMGTAVYDSWDLSSSKSGNGNTTIGPFNNAGGPWTFNCIAGSEEGRADLTVTDCGPGTTWSGSACVTSCANNAINPPSCNQCPTNSNYIWNAGSSSCVQNSNVGSCSATSASPTQGCVCLNGATNPTACTTCPSNMVMNGSGQCVTCSNGGCSGGVCNNGATNPPSCDTCPSNMAMNGSNQCVVCSNGGCSGGVCANGANNPPSCNVCPATHDWRAATSSCIPKPVIGTFTVAPTTITSGSSATLSWTGVTGATSCNITGTPGSDPGTVSTFPNGSIGTGNRGNDTIFDITCTNGISNVSAQAQLVVGAGPSVTANATPSIIPEGGNLTTLSFSGSNLGGNGGCTGERSDTSSAGPWYATWPLSKDDREQSGSWSPLGPFSNDAWYRYICYNNASVASAPAIVHVNVDKTPTANINPSLPQTIAPGNSINFTSSANDVDLNINEHTIDWTDNTGKWNYEVGHVVSTVSDSNQIGTVGTISPAAGSNNNGIRLTFNNPGTYSVRASVQDNNNPYAYSSTVIVSVQCPSGSSWNGSTCIYTPATFTLTSTSPTEIILNWDCQTGGGGTAGITRAPGSVSTGLPSAQSNASDTSGVTANTYYEYTLRCFVGATEVSTAVRNITTPDNLTVDVLTTCDNGSINAPDCNNCGPDSVFDGRNCVSSITAFNYLNVPFCGNGVVETGEECDGGSGGTGSAGLSSPNSQRCTAQCTIACKDKSLNAPSCGGATLGKVYTSGGVQVTACVNGALQSSAPACNVCPQGDVLVGTVCKSPVCGDNVRSGEEQCDGSGPSSGTTAGNVCTSGCYQVPSGATACSLQNFQMSCTGATNFEITDGASNVRAAGAYSSPVTFNATGEDTYTFKCLNGATQVSASRAASCAEGNSYNSIIIGASPKSIQKNGAITINWNINNPNSFCKVVAQPVITSVTPNCDAFCVADRAREAARLTSTLKYGETDAADGSRSIADAIGTGAKATGRKTVSAKYSTVFTGSCALNALRDQNAAKVRVQVVGDTEG